MTTAAIYTGGDPYPVGPVPGVGTMSFHPDQGPDGPGSSVGLLAMSLTPLAPSIFLPTPLYFLNSV